MAELTPFQTIGPFFHHALPFAGGETLIGQRTEARPIAIEGTVRDGAGAPIPDALVEIWQADANGGYDLTFDGFGRTPTDAAGRYSFVTFKPGSVPGPSGRMQAPHVLVGILARGILTRLVTRIYFDDEPANDSDPILELVPVDRRSTLLARREAGDRYRFDICVQGEDETVFFDA